MSVFWTILIVLCGAVIVLVAVSQLKGVRGWWGELMVRAILASLPREYRSLYDVRFNVGRSRCQIDHLVVSPYGIFVIETKSFLGVTVGDSRLPQWKRYVLGMRYVTRSPLVQNQRHVELLKAKYPEVDGCLSEAVKSVVVFGFGSIIRMRDKADNVMTLFTLRHYIRRHKRKLLTRGQLQSIIEKLEKRKRTA